MTVNDSERHDAFLRLFVEHEEAVRGFVRALVASREDAREVMQEVAAVLWRKFDGLEHHAEFRAWAFGVARLQVREFFRDRGRDRLLFGEDVQTLIEQRAESAAAGFDARREALEECLQKLPPDQRELVDTAYEPGARIDALAEQMRRTPMALYKTLHRIRLALMDCTRRVLAREGLA